LYPDHSRSCCDKHDAHHPLLDTLFDVCLKTAGKAPGDVTAREGAVDLPDYVAEVVKENWTAEVFDLELMKGPAAPSEEELMTALQLAMRCVTPAPASRPEMDEVVHLLQDLQPEEQVQSSPSA
jgi:hypothetical protein